MWRPHHFVLTERLGVYRCSLHVVMLIATGARVFLRNAVQSTWRLSDVATAATDIELSGSLCWGNEKCMWMGPAGVPSRAFKHARLAGEELCGSRPAG